MELAASRALGGKLHEEYPLTEGTYYWPPQEILVRNMGD